MSIRDMPTGNCPKCGAASYTEWREDVPVGVRYTCGCANRPVAKTTAQHPTLSKVTQ